MHHDAKRDLYQRLLEELTAAELDDPVIILEQRDLCDALHVVCQMKKQPEGKISDTNELAVWTCPILTTLIEHMFRHTRVFNPQPESW